MWCTRLRRSSPGAGGGDSVRLLMPELELVFGQYPNLVIKENREDYVREYAKKVFRYE